MKFKQKFTLLASLLLALILAGNASLPAAALSTLPATVIDDFEDNDTSDWGFFGGHLAGGGGGPLMDRPAEGAVYLSTGWGGEGTTSGFYGGFFKNWPDAGQVVPPADPWLNVWVLNQSNATVDQYTLELTIREDLNGDGWTNGAEDSFRLDTVFVSSSFNDEWMLVSAPVSSFTNMGTGGDGTFNGNLDEIVLVIAGVVGGSGSVVEADFDFISFTSGGPLVDSLTVFDDMEHGDPFGNGWFAFPGAVGGGGIGPNSADLPPEDGGVFSLETGWGSGGVPGFLGGFGRGNPVDLTSTTHFNFWINPDAGQDYLLEINLQDDDTGDNVAANTDNDDEFQFNCVVSPTGPCAISGGGWQQVSIPLDDFFDDNSFFTGGNGVLDAVPTSSGGNGQLINIVFAVISNSGADAVFRTDYWAFSDGPLATPMRLVDDFENGLPMGSDGDGVPVGWLTFSDGSPIGIATTDTPPEQPPEAGPGNNVMAMTGDVIAFAGFIHNFENAAADTWVSQDWSQFQGFSLWVYGYNNGVSLFIDILDNRNPGSTTDDAERYTVTFVDDFNGWKKLEFPFSSFTPKPIGNGAPADGFTLTQVHGWALGTLNTPGEITYYVDDAYLYGEAEIPELTVSYESGRFEIEEGTTGNITVKLNRALNSEDPAQVSVDFYTEPGVAIPGREYTPTAGTLTFINGGPSQLTFPIETFDDTKWEGDERIVLRLHNYVDVMPGFAPQSSAFITENDPYDPNLIDDFSFGDYLMSTNETLVLDTVEFVSGDADAIPGQDMYEQVLWAAPLAGPAPRAVIEQVRADLAALLPTGSNNADNKINSAIGYLDDALDASRWVNDYMLVDGPSDVDFHEGQLVIIRLGQAISAAPALEADILAISDEFFGANRDLVQVALNLAIASEGDAGLIALAESHMDQAAAEGAAGRYLQAMNHYREALDAANDAIEFVVPATPTIAHEFAIGDDWSHGEAMTFWYYGSNSGEEVGVGLKDNRAPDPGPAGWNMVWSEEFNDPAGTPPNPENWTYEIGDVTPDGKNGWGNNERQYYTDDPANAATDGNGNMVLTVREADGSQECYYGTCEYTSARLISWRKAEFAYGRIESRILVPEGGGIWPAFWSLGTDIDLVSWPQTGEIDFMEFVGRLPNEIFGTIHGPGYAGGNSFGSVYDFGEPVFNNYHTFTVEWEPDLIRWYVDGILYHTATPADVAPNEWVFNDPVFLLLNVAIGGNFGGDIDPNIALPQSMSVDYIRVYQGPDTAERFESSFVDNFEGWQLVEVPFSSFTRSAEQPAGAPNDGLNLNEVWGYSVTLPAGGSGSAMLDQVRVKPIPPPTALTVTSAADSGAGSLRDALAAIATDGIITLDPALAGSTIALTSGQLVVDRNVTIDGSAAPGVVISGNGMSRVFQINATAAVNMNDLTISDGVAAPFGGGILNYGTLSLDYVVVTNNSEVDGGAPNFEFGGGGIYNGWGATLNLTNSTVSNNSTIGQPGGGIYGFFESTLNITNSTISGNFAGDVAGGFRTLGDATIINSTISGNTSNAWHGGAMFITDGVVDIINSTIVNNNAPGGTAGALFVGTFGDASVTVTLQNTIVANNGDFGCLLFYGGGGAVTLTSLGNNVFSDGTCGNEATDQIVGVVGFDVLGDNGGPTMTHALLPGSVALDAANGAACPATDQRGVARPQGAGCDVGAYERE